MQPDSPGIAAAFRAEDRRVERELRKDRVKLFMALEEFAMVRDDKEAWTQFRKRWPKFFPEEEYEKVADGERISVADYPYWLNQIWVGGEDDPYLGIMMGIRPTPKAEDLTPEESFAACLSSIKPELFQLEWQTSSIRYYGRCDFQKALYLLYRESWRARICEVCEAKFIAKRSAQKYCSTDCSESMQRGLKKKWWAEHGQEWRKERKASAAKPKGVKDGTHKAR